MNDPTGGLKCLQITMYIHILVKKAIELGMDELCFTEHSDYDVPTVVNCDYDAYFKEMEEMKEKYKGQITLKTGIEF